MQANRSVYVSAADPLSETCAYCGSKAVLDDAWWCHRAECWRAASRAAEEEALALGAHRKQGKPVRVALGGHGA